MRKKIAHAGIETSTITSRAKTLNSFLEKLQRKGYESPFEELTDLAGARVVCLYRADSDKVAGIIRSEFMVDEEVDKLDELGADQFGYGARHFIVRLGKASSGARYDDLKALQCEVQVRTVVQDAWAIIQHHMVYKRESQVPTQLQRKLNSLAGLFETVDDQFERIREEREAYIVEVRDSTSEPGAFLENELNLDSFEEYLKWKFPRRPIESWEGQARLVLDVLLKKYKVLREVDKIILKTMDARSAVFKEFKYIKTREGKIPSALEAALAFTLEVPDTENQIPWNDDDASVIADYRKRQKELS